MLLSYVLSWQVSQCAGQGGLRPETLSPETHKELPQGGHHNLRNLRQSIIQLASALRQFQLGLPPIHSISMEDLGATIIVRPLQHVDVMLLKRCCTLLIFWFDSAGKNYHFFTLSFTGALRLVCAAQHRISFSPHFFRTQGELCPAPQKERDHFT